MTNSKIYVIACIVLLAWSCKNEQSKNKESNEKSKIEKETAGGIDITPGKDVDQKQIAIWVSEAKSDLKYRTDQNTKAYPIIDVGVWVYEGEYKKGAFTAPELIKDKWIDFDQNLKYQYGTGSRVEGSGKYHFNMDDHLMLMVDDDPLKVPHEYKLNLVNEVCIFQGQPTYDDDGIQAKLVKKQERPK